jgi:hypothetical protein
MLTSSSNEYSDSRMASIFLISFSLVFKGGRFPEDRLVSSVSTKEGFRVSPNLGELKPALRSYYGEVKVAFTSRALI